MKQKILLLVSFLALMIGVSSANALVINLDNWGFNPQGAYAGMAWDGTYKYDDAANGITTGDTIQIDQIAIIGNGLINGTGPNTFSEFGTFSATAFQNDTKPIAGNQTGLGQFGPAGGYELTFKLSDVTGTFFMAGGTNHLNFDTAKLDIYIHDVNNYGTTDSVFGADDGVRVGAFTLQSGTGSIVWGNSPPDGSTNLDFMVDTTAAGLTNGLLPGVWFDEDGKDLSTYPPELLVLGITDSNNEVVTVDPDSNLFKEYDGQDGLVAANNDPFQFFVESDGSFDPAVVPEPATLVLFGIGLLGLAGIGRRRVS